jgi:F0F1-type ATP synthase assembly protein I
MEWGTRITAIGLEFALPALVGFGLDWWWNTTPWLTLLGSFLGLAIGMYHVFRLASELSRPSAHGKEGRRPGPQGGDLDSA